MAQVQHFVTSNRDNRDVLIVVFLRGGADGLSMVAPIEDDGYYRARPRIAISKSNAIPLDGFFGLNPLLKDLALLYREGKLTIAHATGSEDDTRSHFEAQDLMEHGGLAGGGWLGRFLRARAESKPGPLTAVAIGRTAPESLRGAPSITVMEDFEKFSLGDAPGALTSALAKLYGKEKNRLGHAGMDTLASLHRIETLRDQPYVPARGADYGNDRFSSGLQQIARMIKGRVGLEAACIDLQGWDSHAGQSFIMDPLLKRFGRGLFAFCRDLQSELEKVTVVVMTEFGRRLAENSAFGTDHGRGSVMFVAGGGVRGGQILGRWPGLSKEVLDGPGDLPVTTNYRDILASVLSRHAPELDLGQVFPKFPLKPFDLY